MSGALRMSTARMAVAGGGFEPDDAATSLALWLLADSLALADGTAVSSWTDLSGNGRHFAQATSANRPIYKTSIVNGHAVIRFDGADDYLSYGSSFGLSAAEAFLVVKSVSEADGDGWWHMSGASAANHTPFTDGNIYDGFGSTARKSTGNPSASLTSWTLYNVITVSGEWTSNINGTQHFTTATNTVGWPTTNFLGQGNVGPAVGLLACDMAEFFVYTGKLSSGDRTSVKSYIATRYGLTIA